VCGGGSGHGAEDAQRIVNRSVAAGVSRVRSRRVELNVRSRTSSQVGHREHRLQGRSDIALLQTRLGVGAWRCDDERMEFHGRDGVGLGKQTPRERSTHMVSEMVQRAARRGSQATTTVRQPNPEQEWVRRSHDRAGQMDRGGGAEQGADNALRVAT